MMVFHEIFFSNFSYYTLIAYTISHFEFDMGSTFVTYVNRTGAKTTFKLAYCGYTYTRRGFKPAKEKVLDKLHGSFQKS